MKIDRYYYDHPEAPDGYHFMSNTRANHSTTPRSYWFRTYGRRNIKFGTRAYSLSGHLMEDCIPVFIKDGFPGVPYPQKWWQRLINWVW